MEPVAPFTPITKAKAAEILSVTERTLENWIAAGELPAPATIGGRRYWDPEVFYAWLKSKLAGGVGRAAGVVTTAVSMPRESTKSTVPANPANKSTTSAEMSGEIERYKARQRLRLARLSDPV